MRALTEKQVAEILCQSVQTLRNHRFLGKGVPYVKIGRSVRYLVEDVEHYLQAHRIKTDPARGRGAAGHGGVEAGFAAVGGNEGVSTN